MKDSKGTSGSVKDATARLERVFRDLQADVYALHKIGDYPNKKADFDVLNSVAAHMEFKLVTMDESTKKAKTIKGWLPKKTELIEQRKKKDETILFLTKAKKDLAKKSRHFKKWKNEMNDLEGNLVEIKEAMKVGVNGN